MKVATQLAKRVAASVPELACDLAGLAGAGSVTYGAWQVYPPAGWIVGGIFGLVMAWLVARARAGES